MNHYTYNILHTPTQREYLGLRSTKLEPINDIGVKYFSSSKDKEFRKDQKENPEDYRYLVLRTFDTREEAIQHEIYLHQINDVGVNPKFYNRSKQTSIGFDTTGLETYNKGKTNLEIHGEERAAKISKKISMKKIQSNIEIKADPVRNEARSKNMSAAQIKTQAAIKADPERSAARSKKLVEAHDELKADPERSAARSKKISEAADIIKSDPIKAAERTKRLKQADLDLKSDPQKLEQKRLKCSKAAIKRENDIKNDPIRSAARSKNMSEGLINYYRTHDNPSKGVKRPQTTGGKNPAARLVLINGIEYGCLRDACKSPEVPFKSPITIRKRLNDPLNTDYLWIT